MKEESSIGSSTFLVHFNTLECAENQSMCYLETSAFFITLFFFPLKKTSRKRRAPIHIQLSLKTLQFISNVCLLSIFNLNVLNHSILSLNKYCSSQISTRLHIYILVLTWQNIIPK